MKPLILISNDDGIGSPYLQALAEGIDAAGFAEALVVAPERQRSAASHAITLHKPVRLHRHGPNRHSLSGTPVDCVYIGVFKLAQRRPALIISGINRGYNLGMDVFYSGTVAAAVEGGLRDIPAMALSIDGARDSDLDAAVRFSVALSQRLVENGLPPRTILNVNFPARSGSTYSWTHLGNRVYEDDVAERLDPRGQPYYWIGGGIAALEGDQARSDCDAVARGIVSVTPLHLDMTCRPILDAEALWSIDGYQPAEMPAEMNDGKESP